MRSPAFPYRKDVHVSGRPAQGGMQITFTKNGTTDALYEEEVPETQQG